MECVRIVKGLAVSLAVLGFCLPCSLFAASPTPIVTDVALMDGGVLVGQVVDTQGAGLSKVPVAIQSQGQTIGTIETNEQGHFSAAGLQSGLHQVSVANSHGTYRLWAPGTAPPSAQRGALVVTDNQTVRGQCSDCDSQSGGGRGGGIMGFLTNPWVVAGIVATAIAVPVAIHNSKKPSSP